MKIDILTLFPDMFASVFQESILKRAQDSGVVEIMVHNLRDWATDKHKTVDDTPYGGGPGMVLKVDVIDRALSELKKPNTQHPTPNTSVILLTPQGQPFSQAKAQELTSYDHLILIAGHYEGFDERVRALVDHEISIGDYVLTGGELPAMIITDAVARLLPGVLGTDASSEEESFTLKATEANAANEARLLEYPHYTRPETYTPISNPELGDLSVPDVLKSGNHAAIAAWRLEQAKERTQKRRPDLIER